MISKKKRLTYKKVPLKTNLFNKSQGKVNHKGQSNLHICWASNFLNAFVIFCYNLYYTLIPNPPYSNILKIKKKVSIVKVKNYNKKRFYSGWLNKYE